MSALMIARVPAASRSTEQTVMTSMNVQPRLTIVTVMQFAKTNKEHSPALAKLDIREMEQPETAPISTNAQSTQKSAKAFKTYDLEISCVQIQWVRTTASGNVMPDGRK